MNGVSQFNGEGTFQDGISLQKVVQENTSCPKTGAIARPSAGVIFLANPVLLKDTPAKLSRDQASLQDLPDKD